MRNHQACESEFPRVSIAQNKRHACFFSQFCIEFIPKLSYEDVD